MFGLFLNKRNEKQGCNHKLNYFPTFETSNGLDDRYDMYCSQCNKKVHSNLTIREVKLYLGSDN